MIHRVNSSLPSHAVDLRTLIFYLEIITQGSHSELEL